MAGGRPTKFKPEFIQQARVACAELEATDQELANLFGVDRDTIDAWKNTYPEFSDTIKRAKDTADRKVELSLHKRALGYEKKVQRMTKWGDLVETKEEIPPDPVSCIFWLKNRRSQQWRDKQEHELTGKDGAPLAAVINFGTKPEEK